MRNPIVPSEMCCNASFRAILNVQVFLSFWDNSLYFSKVQKKNGVAAIALRSNECI